MDLPRFCQLSAAEATGCPRVGVFPKLAVTAIGIGGDQLG